MAEQTPNRGRPPKLESDRLVQRTLRLPPGEWKKVDEAGGMPALRKLISRWRPATARQPSTSPQ